MNDGVEALLLRESSTEAAEPPAKEGPPKAGGEAATSEGFALFRCGRPPALARQLRRTGPPRGESRRVNLMPLWGRYTGCRIDRIMHSCEVFPFARWDGDALTKRFVLRLEAGPGYTVCHGICRASWKSIFSDERPMHLAPMTRDKRKGEERKCSRIYSVMVTTRAVPPQDGPASNCIADVL